MRWIPTIPEPDATGELAELFAQERSVWGVDHILKIHSLNPPSLKAQAIADFETYLRLVPNASDRAQVEQWLRELKGQ